MLLSGSSRVESLMYWHNMRGVCVRGVTYCGCVRALLLLCGNFHLPLPLGVLYCVLCTVHGGLRFIPILSFPYCRSHSSNHLWRSVKSIPIQLFQGRSLIPNRTVLAFGSSPVHWSSMAIHVLFASVAQTWISASWVHEVHVQIVCVGRQLHEW